MAHIQVLDSGTINKIAAGEVIERPASIVKELVENSIDAGATAITVEIRDGGISYLRVTDNGSGIESREVRNAFLRHSTSKIRSVQDLELVTFLGFRGEALASIAAVSRTEVLTKTPEALTGVRYIIEGGKEQLWEEVAAVSGTTFKIEELFFNTPARRKFLKKPGAEAAAVTDFMQKIAMGHPEISFQYIRGASRILHTPGDYRLKSCIYAVYGKEILGELLRSEYDGAIRIEGYVSRPQLTRANRGYEHFYLNGRMIRSHLLEKTVEECYKDLIMPGNFPVAVLRLSIDPQLVDVNVHPSKMEVRFSDENLVREEVYKAVSQTLAGENLMTRVVETEPVREALSEEKERNWSEAFPVIHQAVPRTASVIEPREKTPRAAVWQDDPYYSGRQEALSNTVIQDSKPEYGRQEPEPVQEPSDKRVDTRFPDPGAIRLVGQAFGTYWLAECGEMLYMMDQHAAHERVLYDRIRAVLNNGRLDAQILLEPEAVTLSPADFLSAEENRELFERMGFEIEPFGEDTVLLRCVPYIFNGPMDPADFRDMASLLTEGSRSTSQDILLDKMAMMACKAAVKGNRPMSPAEASALFESLSKTSNPYNCPHGRPTIVTMTRQQMEKLFKRIV